jgi:hypothetical protein
MRLIELNVRHAAYPLNNQCMPSFMDSLDKINDLVEAIDRLAHLQKHGSTDQTFGWEFTYQSAWRRSTIATEQIT